MLPFFPSSSRRTVRLIVGFCALTTIVTAKHAEMLSIKSRLLHVSTLPQLFNVHRGGATTKSEAVVRMGEEEAETIHKEEKDRQEEDITQHPEFSSLQSYRMQQQVLLQLRSTYLSEALARRGLPIPTLADVSTPDGATPPQPVDWDCAMATKENPRSCLYSFDPQPGTKVVAPLGSQDWISLAALNRLRRDDPTKVEPMWHSKYAILDSWFHPESQFSLLQHVGVKGFLLNALLQGVRLQMALALSLLVATIILMPTIEYIANRFLVSGLFWINWHQWYRWVHAALPLKLLMGQMFGKFLLKMFSKLVVVVKDRLVEIECEILEQSIPLTIGVPDMTPPNKETDHVDTEEEFLVVDPTDDQDDEGDGFEDDGTSVDE